MNRTHSEQTHWYIPRHRHRRVPSIDPALLNPRSHPPRHLLPRLASRLGPAFQCPGRRQRRQIRFRLRPMPRHHDHPHLPDHQRRRDQPDQRHTRKHRRPTPLPSPLTQSIAPSTSVPRSRRWPAPWAGRHRVGSTHTDHGPPVQRHVGPPHTGKTSAAQRGVEPPHTDHRPEAQRHVGPQSTVTGR